MVLGSPRLAARVEVSLVLGTVPSDFAISSKLLRYGDPALIHGHSDLTGMGCDVGTGSFKCSSVMNSKIWKPLTITIKGHTADQNNTNMLQQFDN